MEGTGSEVSTYQYWMNNRGTWLAWVFSVAIIHFLLMSIPFFSTPTVWTLTHLIHNVVVYMMFHYFKGTPFVSRDQGASRRLTGWEQMDDGEQLTSSRKFIIAVTIVLFFLASMYTIGDNTHTAINLATLALGIVPKFSFLHKFRLFGINKY